MMRLWSIAMPLLLATSQLAVADVREGDHLEPCDPGFAVYGDRVGISVDKGRYFVTHVAFQRSLWDQHWGLKTGDTFSFDVPRAKVQPKAKTARISVDLYEALSSEWARSTEAAHPKDDSRLGTVVIDRSFGLAK